MRVNIRWRFVIASAIIAMAVSLLIGGVKGIHLGTIMIRASIGAAVFTVLAVGINLLVMNLFPEFFDAAGSKLTKYNGDYESPGSLVDFTLPPEEPENSELNPADGDTEQAAGQVNEGIAPVNESERFSDFFPEVDEIRPEPQKDESSVLGSERDPEELAQAIHTVITRDEKG